jgi:hypothetical protein
MAMTNHERVGKALDLLRAGLGLFVERELQGQYRGQARAEAVRLVGDDRNLADKPIRDWDVAALLRVMWEGWNEVFRRTLGQTERSLVSELWDWRNKWAHQEPFSSDDAYRALDSADRLLSAVSAPQVEELERMKMELLRVRFDEQVRAERRKAGGTLVEAAATGALKPWREVVSPHPDVASGRYQEAEFAADLWQVYLGEASSEYQDPVEFFRRTYLTENLKRLLVNAVRRLSGAGGDPVVQLQTNFGGGKTHAMIALYHLFFGKLPAELPGVEAVMAEAGAHSLPPVRRGGLSNSSASRRRWRGRWSAGCGKRSGGAGPSAASMPSRSRLRTSRTTWTPGWWCSGWTGRTRGARTARLCWRRSGSWSPAAPRRACTVTPWCSWPRTGRGCRTWTRRCGGTSRGIPSSENGTPWT